MYLDNILSNYGELNTFKSGATTYAPCYRFWRNYLFAFLNKIFTVEVSNIPQKEILMRNFLRGFSGIVRSEKNGELISVDANMYGITQYVDEFTNFTYATPLESGSAVIGVDGVIINNDELRNGCYYLIHHYAVMLAHTEVSFINALVNGRSSNAIVANTQKSAESARAFRERLYKGAPDIIVDTSFVGLDFKDMHSSQSLNIKELFDVRNIILTQFYEDIGVKRANEKRERLISDEANANNSLLRLNISNMFDCLKKGCEEVERVFGEPATVKCNVDIDGDGTIEDSKEGEPEYETSRTI